MRTLCFCVARVCHVRVVTCLYFAYNTRCGEERGINGFVVRRVFVSYRFRISQERKMMVRR